MAARKGRLWEMLPLQRAVSKEELPRHVSDRDCNRECPQTLRPQTGPSRAPAAGLAGVRPRVCRAPGAASRPAGVTRNPCLVQIHSAAKSEKLANRCPLCHENFSPGEEVRGDGRGLTWGGTGVGGGERHGVGADVGEGLGIQDWDWERG